MPTKKEVAELLKEAVDLENKITSFNSQARFAEQKLNGLEKTISDLQSTISELEKQEDQVKARIEDYNQRAAIKQAEIDVNNKIKMDDIARREELVSEREKEVKNIVDSIVSREEDLVRREKDFEIGMGTVKKMMVDTQADIVKVSERSVLLDVREKELNNKEISLSQREKVLNSKEVGLTALSNSIQKQNADFNDRFQKNIDREKLIVNREIANAEKEKKVARSREEDRERLALHRERVSSSGRSRKATCHVKKVE